MRLLCAFASATLVLALLPLRANPASAQISGVPADCPIDESTTVDVLLLLDQSGSLVTRDPPPRQRVVGAKAVVSSYAALAETVDEVRIQVAGFGTGFDSSGWQVLNDQSTEDMHEEVERVGAIDSDEHTDYVYAVQGAVDAFEQSDTACKTLFWFTDGEHDLDERFLAGGLERDYLDDGEVVTVENYTDIEDQMPERICGDGGLADQLGELDVATQVMLLGDGDAMDPSSSRVLRGMGGDASLNCGPGNGAFENVSEAEELPFRMACASQPGWFELREVEADQGEMTIDAATLEGTEVSFPLMTDLRVIAWGEPNRPPTIAQTTFDGLETEPDNASGIIVSDTQLDGEPFEIEMAGVTEACGFVLASPPDPILRSETPTLYRGESGEFSVVVDGPHGRLTGEDLLDIEVAADRGEVSMTDDGWLIEVSQLPSDDSFELTVTASAGPLPPSTVPERFTLAEQIGAPRLVSQPPPLQGEGSGPFRVDVEVDGQDGGRLCLATRDVSMATADDIRVTVNGSLEGDSCVDVPPGPGHTFVFEVDLDRQAFAHGVLVFETVATPETRPDREEQGSLSLDLEVTPEANTTVVILIVAALLVLLAGLIWATLYGVNKLVSRIPDPRKNGVRYGDFVAEIQRDDQGGYEVSLVEAPVDTALRSPKRTPSQLSAGRLNLNRKVPLFPWISPYAELTAGYDETTVQSGAGVSQRTLSGRRTLRGRPGDALGPLVALGVSPSQREQLDRGVAQRASGVLLFDIRHARGMDASQAVEQAIREALERIAGELATQDGTVERTM